MARTLRNARLAVIIMSVVMIAIFLLSAASVLMQK